MQHFRVLLVDDQRAYYDQVAYLMDEVCGLEIVHARSQDDAIDAIEADFFHLAIVDVSLRGQARTDKDGLFVLERLADVRPTCERVLYTTSVGGDDRRQALQAVAPAHGGRRQLANGYLNKADADLRSNELILERALAWLNHPVTVKNADRVLTQLLAKDVRGAIELSPKRKGLRPTEHELDFVLSALFGQGLVDPDRHVDMVSEVELHGMSEGWSRSVTVWCEPRSTSARTGPRCVIKIGPRSDTEQEVTRYRAYVRYGLRLRHRVELLDWCLGDTIGAVCYSHLDAVSSEQMDLQRHITQEDSIGFTSLEQLFQSGRKHWLADVSEERDMAAFFKKEYARPMQEGLFAVTDFVGRDGELSLEGSGAMARAGGATLDLPTLVTLGCPELTGRYKACVVHGDLHGGNILTTDGGQPVIIDYRNMTRGPRLLDFASLEVSLRMSRVVCDKSVANLVNEDLPAEISAWREDWSDEPAEDVDAPYWRRFSGTVRRLARQNFPDATESEYAATCLLRTLRVFMARAPEDFHRRRLLIWLSVLTSVLRGRDP